MGKEIGIDLGTTNTVVSYVNNKGKLRQLNYETREIIPSVIYFQSADNYYIGYKARKFFADNPVAGVSNFKTTLSSSDRHEIIPEEGKPFFKRSREIAQLFLNKIVRGMENRLIKEFGPVEGCIDRAVITVPANFSSTEKNITKTAARAAGLTDVKLAAEPTAAAVAYENSQGNEDSESVILVYDFGGGTFDVSIIRRKGSARDATFEEITTGGDKHLGGNNLTDILAQEILNKINDDYGAELPFNEDDFDEDACGISLTDYKKDMSEIWRTANLIKENLSENDYADEQLNVILRDAINEVVTVEFSREELENYINEYIERSVDITLQTINRAKDEQGIERIDQIVLAGGSSNIPLVKQMLEERLNDQDIVFCDDVSTLISRGAAILAKRYVTFESTSKSVTTVQMGIAANEGVQFGKFQVIIPEDTSLPCTKKRTFRLPNDNMPKFEIKYYERDIKNSPDAIYIWDKGIEEIDSVMIDNLPPNLKASEVQVEVTFTARKDGTLDIDVELKDGEGDVIKSKKMTFNKKSDLE